MISPQLPLPRPSMTFADLSVMLAGPLVARFGAVETMVYTHMPSNVMLSTRSRPSEISALGQFSAAVCL